MEYVEDIIKAISQLKIDVIGWQGGGRYMPPRAEQDLLSAIAHLELAAIEMQRCDYHRMQDQ